MAHVDRVLNALLDNVANDLKYEESSVKVTPITYVGGNYTSKLFHATISGKDKPDLKLFIKIALMGEKMRTQGLKKIFQTEKYVYTKLKGIYREIEEKHNLPEEHRLEIPDCYGLNETQYEEAIVLNDLTVEGYEVHDRLKPLTWEFAAAAVTELAKIHSLSFAYAAERPEEFDETQKILKVDLNKDETVPEVWKNMLRQSVDVTKEENKEWIKNFLSNLSVEAFVEYFRPLRRAVLIHADSRVSNIMQRVDEDGRVHVRIVDYQTMQGASPVIDLLYFIFTGSDEAFRAQYYDKLIDHYYNELSLAMKRLGLNPDEVYSREDFDYEYKEKLPFGLSIAVFTLPVVTVDAENAPKVDEDMDISCFKVEKTSDLFPERLNGIINDFIRWGVI